MGTSRKVDFGHGVDVPEAAVVVAEILKRLRASG
jgi:hypothetical protein